MKKWIKKLIPNNWAKEIILEDHRKYLLGKKGVRLIFLDANLNQAIFKNCGFQNCSFSGNVFNRARFKANNFSNTCHVSSVFDNCSFEPASSFTKVSSTGKDVIVVKEPSSFKGCTFVHTSLNRAKFRECDMCNTHWDDPGLYGCTGLLTGKLLKAGNFRNRQKEDLTEITSFNNIKCLKAISEDISVQKPGSAGFLNKFINKLIESQKQCR